MIKHGLIAMCLAIAAAEEADAQHRYYYEEYGTELHRLPGGFTGDRGMYRGYSEHAKRRSPAWPRLWDRNRDNYRRNRYRYHPY